MAKRIIVLLEVFEKDAEELVCDFEVPGWGPLDLQNFLQVSDDANLALAWPVDVEKKQVLEKAIGLALDFDRYEYLIGLRTTEE